MQDRIKKAVEIENLLDSITAIHNQKYAVISELCTTEDTETKSQLHKKYNDLYDKREHQIKLLCALYN